MKKFIATLAIALLMILLLQQAVMAAVLEVDTASPMFKADTWQNNEGNDEVCPITKIFDITPMPASGAANSDVRRYSGCVNVNQDNLEGEQVFINGSATNSLVFPFKETVNLDSVTWKFNNGTRQYFFLVYTSMDGTNWTEIDLASANARRGKCGVTYDDSGNLDGPAVDNVWISTPAGSGDDNDVLLITFKFAPSGPAKYLKFTFFGNDGGQGVEEVTHPWISFNNLIIEGSVVVAEAPVVEAPAAEVAAPVAAEAPAVVEAAPVVVATPAPVVTAPRIGDASIIIFAGVMIIAAAGVVIFKRKEVR